MEIADDTTLTCDFETSELGTIEYWENAYDRELKNFKEDGDIGEIWFGEDIQERIVGWLENNKNIRKDDPVLDLGCGNGALLLELRQHGFTNVTGVDFVQAAVALATGVLAKEGFTDVRVERGDLTTDASGQPEDSCLRCLYRVCIDKGTYDAISLMPEQATEGRQAYKRTLKQLLRQDDGLFVITSCNWTKEELLMFFEPDLKFTQEIRTPTFRFGGKVGRTVTSLIFSIS